MDKRTSRLRRALSTRLKIKELKAIRLTIHRTAKHIYAQLLSCDGTVLAAVSSLDPEVRTQISNGGNVIAAKIVGEIIAKRGGSKGVSKVAFDRSGFRFHGRVAALAQAAREHGLDF